MTIGEAEISASSAFEYVYFIRCGDRGPVKIGKATNLRTRMGMLQVGNPHRLRLVLALEILPGHANASDLERMVHRQMKPFRVRGEWFAGDISCRVAEIAADVLVSRGAGRVIRSIETTPNTGT